MLDVEVNLVGNARGLCSLDGLGAEEGRDGDEEEAEREPAEDHGGVEERDVCASASATRTSVQTWRLDRRVDSYRYDPDHPCSR